MENKCCTSNKIPIVNGTSTISILKPIKIIIHFLGFSKTLVSQLETPTFHSKNKRHKLQLLG